MNRWRIVLLLTTAVILTGCASIVDPPPATSGPAIEILDKDTGWVQILVTDVPGANYLLHWGDFEDAYGVEEAGRGDCVLEHFYQDPAVNRFNNDVPWNYAITLQDRPGTVYASTTVTIQPVVDCHISLLDISGKTVTVRYFARWGIFYTLCWGDLLGGALESEGSGVVTHTYAEPGTYIIRFGELVAPSRAFVTVTIE